MAGAARRPAAKRAAATWGSFSIGLPFEQSLRQELGSCALKSSDSSVEPFLNEERNAMNVQGKAIVVTGGASGIGKALVERFHREGAENILVADLNADGARQVADSVGGLSMAADVSKEADVAALARAAEESFGRV